MQNYHAYLGELSSAHRPSTVRIWIMAVLSLGLVMSVLLGGEDHKAHNCGDVPPASEARRWAARVNVVRRGGPEQVEPCAMSSVTQNNRYLPDSVEGGGS